MRKEIRKREIFFIGQWKCPPNRADKSKSNRLSSLLSALFVWVLINETELKRVDLMKSSCRKFCEKKQTKFLAITLVKLVMRWTHSLTKTNHTVYLIGNYLTKNKTSH